jgi:alginate O-acetyltransferase complex protein AlgI
MSFTSGKYMVFLAVVFFAYWLLASARRRVPVIFLLLASYYFYALSNWKFLALVLLISTVDFLTARWIGRSENPRLRKLLLWTSVLTDIGALFSFKYFNFFSNTSASLINTTFAWLASAVTYVWDSFGYEAPKALVDALNGQAAPFVLNVALPLGLSFITFRSLSYVIDVYRKTTQPTTRFIDYLAFVSFFPTVIAGPVVRARELLPQFQERPQLMSEDGTRAIFLILLGLVKKIAIADYLAYNLVGRVFDQPQLYSSVETLAAIYGYAIQIYCDFSGYSDIAIGSAMLMGFRLPVNFNSPYRALNLPDFWRRWHITLSEWLRDYVFSSLPGSPRKTYNLYWKAVVTMLIGGLWHGAGFTFIVWGGMHGVAIAVNQWWEQRRRKQKRRPRSAWWIKAICVFVTFHFVCLTWVFFRASSLSQAWEILARLTALKFETGNLAPPVLAVLFIGYLSHWFPKDALDRVRAGWTWLPSPVQAVLILSIAAGLFYMSSAEVQFIYGNF